MTKTTLRFNDNLDIALKLRLIEETKKARKTDKKARVVTAQKFITELLEKELGIKKIN